mgnify:CR=1 FL=1
MSFFEELLDPITTDEFFDCFYEKKPLLVTGKSSQERFPGFPCIEGMEEILWAQEEKLRRVLRVNRQGSYVALPHPSHGKSLFRWAIDQFLGGCTLILNGTDTMSLPIARVARDIETRFSGKVAANAFFTPANQQGFLAHFDTHDVFILQLDGTKVWPIFDQRIELPIDRQIYLVDQKTVGDPVCTFLLSPGDLLYVPRGFLHGPYTLDEHSLHITMGFRPNRWADYLAALVQVVAENDPLFRSSIPSRDDQFQSELTRVLGRFANLASSRRSSRLAGERIAETLNALLRPLPGQHILAGKFADKVAATTLVVKRTESPCHVYEVDDLVRIQFPGIGLATDQDLQPGCIEAPLSAGGCLRFVARTEAPFTAEDLPDAITVESRLNLVKLLVRNGLLVPVDFQ